MKYKVEISDFPGNSFLIRLTLPFGTGHSTRDNSHWRALDAGFIRYRSGGCEAWSSDNTWYGPADLYLCRGEEWGITLYEFSDWTHSINDSGTGTILQPWCLTLKPYDITWALV